MNNPLPHTDAATSAVLLREFAPADEATLFPPDPAAGAQQRPWAHRLFRILRVAE